MRFLLVLLLAIAACARSDVELAAKPVAAPLKVPLVLAAEAPTPNLLTLTGELAAGQRAEIAAETQGRVIAVLAQRGQRVKRGEAIVELDVRTAALSVREAQASLDAARSKRRFAETECARSASLAASGAIPRAEADREAARCEAALSHVAGAEARTALLAKGVTDGIVRARRPRRPGARGARARAARGGGVAELAALHVAHVGHDARHEVVSGSRVAVVAERTRYADELDQPAERRGQRTGHVPASAFGHDRWKLRRTGRTPVPSRSRLERASPISMSPPTWADASTVGRGGGAPARAGLQLAPIGKRCSSCAHQ